MNLGVDGKNRAMTLLRGGAPSQFSSPFAIGIGVGADENGLVGEPVGNGYARRPITFAGSGSAMSNSADVVFAAFTADMGVAGAWMIFDSTGAKMWWGWFTTAIPVNASATTAQRTIAAGDISGSID